MTDDEIVLVVSIENGKFIVRVRQLPDEYANVELTCYCGLIMGLVQGIARRCNVPTEDIWEFLLNKHDDPPPFGDTPSA